MPILEKEVRSLEGAGKLKRSEFEKSLAQMRDLILMAILSRDLDRAREILKQAQLLVDTTELSDAKLREARCRLMESELHIAEIEDDARTCIQACIFKIEHSPDFEESRRRVVIDLGLQMLSEIG